MGTSLGMRNYRSDAGTPAPARQAEQPVPQKHSLEAIARRMADLDKGEAPPTPAVPDQSGQRLAATLDRVSGLISRLKTESAVRPAPPVPSAPATEPPSRALGAWDEGAHKRETSQAFRERLAAIRAEFDAKSRPGAVAARPPAELPAPARDPDWREYRAGAAPAAMPPAAMPPAAAPVPPIPVPPVARAPEPTVPPQADADLQTALADILARQRRLDAEDRSGGAPPAPRAADRSSTFVGLQREIETLTSRIEAIRPERLDAEIGALRIEVEGVHRAYEDLPARQDALAGGLEALTGRFDDFAGMQVSKGEVAALRSAVADLADRSATADAVARLDAHLEGLAAQTAENAAGLEAARDAAEQSRRVAEHLGSMPWAGDLSVLADQMEALAHQLASVRNGHLPQLDELRTETAAIRSRLSESEQARKRTEAETRALAGQLPAAEAVGRLADRVDELGAQFDAFTTAVVDEATLGRVDMARIERSLAELTERMEASEPQANAARLIDLEDVVRDLAGRLDSAAPPGGDERLDRLEGTVRELAERIEIAGAPNAGPEAVRVLERHVDRLAEQMTSLQEVTIATSERAALAAMRKSGADFGGTHVEALAHHLQALNKATAASERRTQGSLEAMQDALEKIVARMGVLEDDAAQAPRLAGAASGKPPGTDFRAAVQRARAEAGGAAEALLEPGSGPPPGEPELGSEDFAEREGRGGRRTVEFIAAARRAVQSAAVEPRSSDQAYGEDIFGDGRGGTMRQMARIGRRPVVLGIAALVLMMGVIQLVTLTRDGAATGTRQLAQNAARPAAPARVTAPRTPGAPASSLPEVASAATLGGGAPLPEPLPPGAFGDPDMTASIPGVQAQPYAQQPVPDRSGAEQLPREIGGSRLRGLAAGGDPSAEFEVGVRYADGRGLAADPAAAAYWLDRAARQNFAPAQYRLASMYQSGQGVPKDLDGARRWYERAGLLGHVGAMHNLAVMYADGGLGTQDYRQAAAWFRRAAERGLTDSEVNLGVLLSLGLGIKQDLVEAYKWFSLAATQGDAEAASQRDGVEKKLDASSLARARAAVQSFQPLASDPAANVATPPPGGWDSARLGNTRIQ